MCGIGEMEVKHMKIAMGKEGEKQKQSRDAVTVETKRARTEEREVEDRSRDML